MIKIMNGSDKQRSSLSIFKSVMPKTEAQRVAAKRARLYNRAFKELGFLYPSNKSKASAAQKRAYAEVSKEFKKSYKSGDNAAVVWYNTCVKLKYLPNKSQRKAIRRRFKELEQTSKDKDIIKYRKAHK